MVGPVRLAVGTLLGLAIAFTSPVSSAGFGVPRASQVAGSNVPLDWRTVIPPGQSPAERYARMERASCEAELTRRDVPFAPVVGARGVLEPVRLTGSLHGVTFHTGLAPSQRGQSPWEIVDCRLALALDDFAVQLAAHDVTDVVHFSIYRPPSTRWPAEKIASRHPGGLAIDAASFVKRDGTTLVVDRDFHGRIGAKTCGGAGPSPATPPALELRAIVCDATDARLFNVALTPDFNGKHHNHFHLEVAAGSKWFYVH